MAVCVALKVKHLCGSSAHVTKFGSMNYFEERSSARLDNLFHVQWITPKFCGTVTAFLILELHPGSTFHNIVLVDYLRSTWCRVRLL